ncbi:MAG: sugar phosphate isomerase/epimerase [Paraglaciecola sp.]|nr:sugar phosphate isomerase/epimerase [Paraglaciecola sp.]
MLPPHLGANDKIITDLQRRLWLKAGCVLSGLALTGIGFAAAEAKSHAVGLQLYTLRDLMQQNVPETLKLVAGVGYTELEFAGYFGLSALQIRSILDAEGLSAPAVHVSLKQFQTQLPQVINDALIVGHQYLVLPYLLPEQRGQDIASYQRLAAQLNQFAEQCQQAGLKLAYHNHEFEFEPVSGGLPYDTLLAETDPALVSMELDLYWTVKAGFDPVTLFEQSPGRYPLWHVKDMDQQGDFANVGQGVIDFSAIFAHASIAGLQHSFVERDHTDNKISTIQQGYKAVTALNLFRN